MPNELNVMTAPRAVIKRNGKAVGYIRNIRCTETMTRGSVKGVGRLTKRELPALGITCNWSCDQYLINLRDSGIPDVNNRATGTLNKYIDTLTLAEQPVDIYILKKEAVTIVNGVVTQSKEGEFAVLRDVYLNSSSWDITEDQISAHNQSGEYLEPIILSIES